MKIFRKILQKILKILAIIVLKRYKPVVIAITGSVGKTSTKEAIYHVLKSQFGEHRVRRNTRNYNNEIGVPLTIFGLETSGRSVISWLIKFIQIGWMIIFKQKKYPSFLIIEMGADRPGDIKYLTKFVHPSVGVITALGQIPVHIEFFKNPEEVAKEKASLIKDLKNNQTAILNYDDEKVREMKEKTKANVITYGLNEQADLKATNYDILIDTKKKQSKLIFKLEFKGGSVPGTLYNAIGEQTLYSALAAATVGTAFNMNLVEIVEALKNFQPLPGRMRIMPGIKNSFIIDDTYNAALLSMEAAIQSLKIFKERRKIAILGDMLEIGEYAPEAHKIIGRKAAETADLIFTVGTRSKFIAESAAKHNFPKENIFQFDTSEQAKKEVQKRIQQDDIILVKGSRGIKMEKIVEEIMAEPEKAKDILVS
ncbi:MAG: hypothetical protein GF387_00540 [Candidatus Portnoybacteria bacterium]|nr:hypothetical protein [Candidatus Portnoybacteria bacterium]